MASFFFFFFCYRWEVGLQHRCGESKWRMYDELDRSSRVVVVWLKEVRYLLASAGIWRGLPKRGSAYYWDHEKALKAQE